MAYEKINMDSKVNMMIDKISNVFKEELERLMYICL